MNSHRLNQQPIFILCHARTGSTLLRYILDTHESIFAPPEMHLGNYITTLIPILYEIHIDKSPESIYKIANNHISNLFQEKSSQKEIWCDKSVTTIDHTGLIKKIFPNARFICLYRNCLDFIHSAKEITDFKIFGHGFESYLASSKENLIDIFAKFWCDKTTAVLDFELNNPSQCLRITQESIILDTENTIQKIFSFLELPVSKNFKDKVFKKKHQFGAGDYKIQYKNEFDVKSIGKGHSIPVDRMREENIILVNDLSKKLGYNTISISTNNFVFDHFIIGRDSVEFSSLTNSLLEKCINILRSRFKEKPSFPADKDCSLNIRNVKNGIYKIQSDKRDIIHSDALSQDEDKISMDLNTLFEILDNREDFGTALANGKIFVFGNNLNISKFIFLFNKPK